MTTKPKTLEQLDDEVATLENSVDREIDSLHQLIDEANDLVTDVFTMEDELFLIRDQLEELQATATRLAKKPAKGDNMKAPKKKVAPKKKTIPKKKTTKKKASLKEINPLHEATRMAKDSLKVLLRNSKTTPKKRSKK